jgi:hypothetical protein
MNPPELKGILPIVPIADAGWPGGPQVTQGGGGVPLKAVAVDTPTALLLQKNATEHIRLLLEVELTAKHATPDSLAFNEEMVSNKGFPATVTKRQRIFTDVLRPS